MVVDNFPRNLSSINQTFFLGIFVLFKIDSLLHNIATISRFHVIKLCNNILLLDHLDLLNNNLEIDQRKVVQVLEKHPELCHGSSVNNLHQLRHLHVLIALKGFERHVALVRKLLENIGGVLVVLVASEQHS